MKGEALISWLFVGPLLVAMISNLAYQITQIEWIANVAMGSTILTAIILLVAAWPAFMLLFRKKPRDSEREQ